MKRKTTLLTVLATACILAADAQKKSDHNFEVAKNLDIFNNMYRTLDLMYVDTINPGEVIGNGIKAMLRSLDPYTEYYPEEKTKDLKMFLTGKYAGIGSVVKYHQKLKRVVINEPYAGMPAAEAGLKKGDIILSIDDTTMTDKNVSYVSEHLRGEPGTTFVLKAERPSTGKVMTFKITRKNIKMPEIPYYGMRDNNIGYICFNKFVEGSARNMRNAYIDLRKQGARSLILDLRGNGGGSLSEAIDIINMWIPKNVTLVETKGKLKQANKNYTTRHEPIDTVMPIVVLVNDETASASEIAAGSLQDLDRGIILGTRTYGKGLVQLPMELPYNSNMKITTSKYYIPSGRCIQAINYKHSQGGYKEHIADSLTHVFYTKNGREVRDGGGIKPDIEIKPDTMPNIAIYLGNIDSTEVMFDYVVDYITKHPTIASPSAFKLTDADFEEFRQRVIKSGFTYDPVSEKQLGELEKLLKFEGYYEGAKDEFEALKSKLKHDISKDLERNKEVICRMIEQDIISAYYYQSGSIEASLNHDEQIKEAEKLLTDPDRYRKLLTKDK
ncbi:S41 family peptidase [Xylanibacter muris]|uniref:S41 family peptidase n=1 Tax=Xylanibacter muris TaxID=2736290 RepID=A0ABX2ANM4_9BACT|nr:S41 family peptidase [Xylanibacter muris]NPD92548.1 S41 family peptidase [Xylanibacter muris]